MSDTYVYLKNLQGVTIKPVTDLSAINLTTGDGIGVKGNTIGVVAGYVAQTAYTELTDPATAANPDSGYIEGGTMYTLLGGYAVTSDVPPATAASEYRVPSEKAVREAIDAYVATGGSDIVAGKGIDMGGGQINATEATVEETLKGYTVSGGTTTMPFDDQVVMPYDLRGALSLGQAVDVTCEPGVDVGTLTYSTNIVGKTATYLDTITWSGTYSTLSAYFGFGSVSGVWYHYFPKGAPGLKYLFVFDFVCDKSCWLGYYSQDFSVDILNVLNRTYPANTKVRVCMMFAGLDSTTGTVLRFGGLDVGTAFTATITNCRQYEVTALTDEAILALATAEGPDAWFRANARSVNERYLVKPDMVSPWVPIIRMSTNSTALTVGAGLAYAVDVFGGSYTIGVDTFPEDAYGQDAHLELFVKAGSHVTFQPPLSLMDPLQENAGHNITIKFREGRATAYVDDTNYGYIIDVPEGTAGTQAGGSLYFAINGSTSNYAVFSAQLDGSTVTTPNVTANKDITIMGNGTDKTFISGTFGAASGKQLVVKDLTATSVSLSGTGTVAFASASVKDTETAGTVRFTDTAIPTGSTVTGSSATTWDVESLQVDGEFRLYKTTATLDQAPIYLRTYYGTFTLTGSGLLDLAGSGIWLTANSSISGLKIVNSHAWTAIATIINAGDICTISDCVFENNHTRVIHVSRGDLYVTGCTVTGTTSSNTRGVALAASDDGTMYVNNCLIKDNVTNWESVYTTGTNASLYITGSTIHDVCSIVGINSYAEFRDCLMVKAPAAVYRPNNAHMTVYNHTLVRSDDIVATIDSAQVDQITADGYVYNRYGAITIPDSISLWVTSNFIFMSPLDLSKATTVKLKNTVLSGASYVAKSPSQIQLPANSINSFSGNTTAAGTKILKAGTIIVGDDRTNPTGSATIEFVGGSTTLSGIGTYIAKDGTNDFVPIAGNVTSVTTATGTGAGSLQYALTSGTKYAKLANNLVASATFAAATDVVNKDIVTSEYQKVLGGNYTMYAGCAMVADEASHTVTFSGNSATFTDVCIPAGATVSWPEGHACALPTGATVSGGGVFNMLGNAGRLYTYGGYNILIEDLLITGHTSTAGGGNGAVSTEGSDTYKSYITVSACKFSNNDAYYGGNVSVKAGTVRCVYCDFQGGGNRAQYMTGNTGTSSTKIIYSNCTIAADAPTVMQNSGGIVELVGSNSLKSTISPIWAGAYGTVTIASGAIVDLTDNANTTPIAPGTTSGGVVTFAPGGATVYPSAGQASAYMLGGMTVPTIGNTNVVNLGGSNVVISSGTTASARGCVFTGGSATDGGAINAAVNGSLTLVSCVVSGNSASTAGAGIRGANVTLIDTVVSGNIGAQSELYLGYGNSVLSNSTIGGAIYVNTAGVTLAGSNNITRLNAAIHDGTVTISSGASINLTNSINPGGTGGITVLTGGCTVNGAVIPAGTYTQIVSSGGSAIAS